MYGSIQCSRIGRFLQVTFQEIQRIHGTLTRQALTAQFVITVQNKAGARIPIAQYHEPIPPLAIKINSTQQSNRIIDCCKLKYLAAVYNSAIHDGDNADYQAIFLRESYRVEQETGKQDFAELFKTPRTTYFSGFLAWALLPKPKSYVSMSEYGLAQAFQEAELKRGKLKATVDPFIKAPGDVHYDNHALVYLLEQVENKQENAVIIFKNYLTAQFNQAKKMLLRLSYALADSQLSVPELLAAIHHTLTESGITKLPKLYQDLGIEHIRMLALLAQPQIFVTEHESDKLNYYSSPPFPQAQAYYQALIMQLAQALESLEATNKARQVEIELSLFISDTTESKEPISPSRRMR